ncbi:MAG: M20/M25/M40 family metallo-hydrolase [Candidatus Eremiobacteraeota bacterium]|nr:M20/M25/M40 family metallo-hydrolase [Candidatus Eremiobacteraeota bacterium]MBV8365690.1 M20/M25/M40 family metallo-hydrolase [Candidatus Eremiobacteraeota bacterium]
MADLAAQALRDAGAQVRFDDAGTAVGGAVGNIVALLPGTKPGVAPLLLNAHMDTVPPANGVKPQREDGKIRSDGTTILGGDDKSGVAVVVEVVRTLKERAVAHGDIEIAFTICEEIGLLGAKALDIASLRSREALVLDAPSPAELVVKAPSADRFEFVVHGVAAHAGMAPENGISAVRVAAEAIAAMPLGRVDAQTTSNVIVAYGGDAVNVVPDRCVVRGEVRSHDAAALDATTAAIRRSLQDASARASISLNGSPARAWIEERCEREYTAMDVPLDAPIVELMLGAARDLDLPLKAVTIGGGSDANVFNARGVPAVILGTGMREIHTVHEWLDLSDFYTCADLVLRALTRRAA